MNVTLPVVKTVTRSLTYLDARAEVTTEHHDKSPIGLRTITTHWIDDAAPANGGHKAGTTVRKTIKGDGRIVRGPHACVVVIPEAVV